MTTTTLMFGLVVLVMAVVVIAAGMAYARRREEVGPEDAHVVADYGDKPLATELRLARQESVEELDIRPLSSADRVRYAQAWQRAQARFVEDPAASITAADQLAQEVMQTRGYPMTQFEPHAADLWGDHPPVVEHYRAAHAISGQTAAGRATTAELRQAMAHFRTLFEELLATTVAAPAGDHTATLVRRDERRAA